MVGKEVKLRSCVIFYTLQRDLPPILQPYSKMTILEVFCEII